MFSFSDLCVERPLGSPGNEALLALLKAEMPSPGFSLISRGFGCASWARGASRLRQGGREFAIFPSPFSRGFSGSLPLRLATSMAELEAAASEGAAGCLLLLGGELCREPLMPKDFPVYFPEEHRAFYQALERARPACVLALTGKDSLSGLDPFPLFEDGPQSIPSACAPAEILERLDLKSPVELSIDSRVGQVSSEQLVFEKAGESAGRILLCAHMDSKCGSPGALDNAAGLYALLGAARLLGGERFRHTLDIVPFNGEEHYGIPGELEYLKLLEESGETVRLVLNLDAPGHSGSRNALSFYNVEGEREELILGAVKGHALEKGEPWYAGDHAMFALRGTPCLVASSSDLFAGALAATHTAGDLESTVDLGLLDGLAEAIVKILRLADGFLDS
jgi:aminopeptidase YwaD